MVLKPGGTKPISRERLAFLKKKRIFKSWNPTCIVGQTGPLLPFAHGLPELS